jgi:hypothetical protein
MLFYRSSYWRGSRVRRGILLPMTLFQISSHLWRLASQRLNDGYNFHCITSYNLIFKLFDRLIYHPFLLGKHPSLFGPNTLVSSKLKGGIKKLALVPVGPDRTEPVKVAPVAIAPIKVMYHPIYAPVYYHPIYHYHCPMPHYYHHVCHACGWPGWD